MFEEEEEEDDEGGGILTINYLEMLFVLIRALV